MNSLTHAFDQTVYDSLSILRNPLVSTVITTALIAYASLIAPTLPSYFVTIFNNNVVKFVCLALIAYMGTNNPSLAVISTVVLMTVIQLANTYELKERFEHETKKVANCEAKRIVNELVYNLKNTRGIPMGLASPPQDINRHSLKSVPVDKQEQKFHMSSFCVSDQCKKDAKTYPHVPLIGRPRETQPLTGDHPNKNLSVPLGVDSSMTNNLMPIHDFNKSNVDDPDRNYPNF